MFITYEPTQIETIIRDRIRISISAWAYEQGDVLVMTDFEFDTLANKVDSTRSIPTGRDIEDKFFLEWFDRSTGMWIHKHPDLVGIQSLYIRYWSS